MARKIFGFGSLVLAVFAFASLASAEDAKIGSMTLDELKKALGMSIYLQGGYTYNLENPDSQENDLRVFDHKANSFVLDLAQIVFAKDAPMNGVGYKLKISAGETAKWIHSRGLSGNDPNDPDPLRRAQAGPTTNAFDLTEAYVSYMAPLGKGLRFDFGKMVTYHGAEVIEAIDNPNYSRSFLFNYSIPFTHTGLKMGYTFSDAFNASVHIVNGWDNTDDNNKAKTYGLSLGWTPAEAFSTVLNLMSGPEQDNNTKNNRDLVDWVGTIKATKKLSLILNADYGREQNAAAAGGAAEWSGVAGIVKYDFSDTYGLAVRSEYFNDKDGARTGSKQDLREVTVTPEIRLNGGLIVRPEYRHDWSDTLSFNGGVKKSQDTIALGAMYRW